MPTDVELKERATSYLRRVSEIATTTTRTAIIALGALAIIWFNQIYPQYHHLQTEIYPKLRESYAQELKEKMRLQRFRRKTSLRAEDTSKVLLFATDTPEYKSTGNKKIVEARENIKAENAVQKQLVESVSFDVFGLKLPVPPLYAAAVWNLVLLLVIMYLAQARSKIWTLSANALCALKKLKERPASLDDIAGSAPLWLAPSPSRPGRIDVTTEELRSAFGWNRLHTLPSIVTTIGFLLLGLLQLTVTTQGLQMIRNARELTTAAPAASLNRIENNPVAKLLLDSNQAALLSLVLVLTLVATIALVVWWFRPSSVPDQFADATATPRHFARAFLSVAAIISLSLLVGWLRPSWGWWIGDQLHPVLPAASRFLASSMIVFCLVELIALAVQPVQRPGGLNEDRRQ